MSLISVIIPNYNHAPYLNKRIDSVLNQTYSNFEVIILDDCSRDNSKKVIEQYHNHPRVSHIVYNKQNSGSVFQQWRKGIELSKGEWIWIAESDDWCADNFLHKLINITKKDKDIVLSYSQSYEVDEKGKVIRDMTWWTQDLNTRNWNKDYINQGVDETLNFLLYKNSIPNASAVIFRKDIYLKADKKFLEMRLCGDWMLWVELLKEGKVSFCSSPLNFFRTHSTTTRVLDSYSKMQLRKQEEYTIALKIEEYYAHFNKDAIKRRLQEIIKEYGLYLTRLELIKFILKPNSFKSSISLRDLLLSKVHLY